MLQTIREKIQGIIAGIIIGFICLTFAVWGIESYLNEARKVVVAEVGGDDVELAEYQEAFQRLRQRAQTELGDAFEPDVWAEEATKLRVLDFIVEDRVLGQVLDASRITVGPEQVAEFLQSSPNFQVDGKFSSQRYTEVTGLLGFSERAFEAQARRDLALEQLRTGVAGSAFTTPQELDQLARLEGQVRDVGIAIVDPADPAGLSIADAEVEAYFGAHQEDFRVPDKVALEYVELRIGDLLRQVSVEESELLAYYEAHQADFTIEEQRSANHILVQLKPEATPEETAEARRKIEGLRERIAKGGDFAALAREFSDDVGSRAEGGATGLFGRGVMAPEFEEAVFAMKKVGEVSQPIKTDFGFHLIKLAEIKAENLTAYEDARGEIEQRLKREKAEELFYETAERFSETVYEYPDSLTDAAEQLDIKVEKTSAQTREEVAALFSPAVADAAWETEVLTQGLVSPPIEIGDERIVAVRVADYQPSHLPKLAEITRAVSDELRLERVRDDARARGEALLEKLRKGEAPEVAAKAAGLSWERYTRAGRLDERINRTVLRAAFRAPLTPTIPKSTVGVEIGDGRYAVLQVAAVADQPSDTTAAATGREREAMVRGRAVSGWRDFVSALSAEAHIEKHPDRL